MNELQEKTIAALTKQVELLGKDGVSREGLQECLTKVDNLCKVMHEVNQLRSYIQPLTAE